MQKNLGAECLDHAEDAVCQKDEWQQPRYPIHPVDKKSPQIEG
jgi:hypothetical protein